MRVLIAGGTGFIGRALVDALLRSGHQTVVWARSKERARQLLGTKTEILPIADGPHALARELARCDGVVNLAGESILGGRWTEARRGILTSSRVDTTRQLVEAMAAATTRPKVLVSSSAVGYYGNCGDAVLTEESPAGNDFLAQLCVQWESAARAAQSLGVRVVVLRTGVVLGKRGGALAQMLPPFRLGVGGPIGSGRQYMPWIHLDDLVRIMTTALDDPRYDGAIDSVAPEEATSRDFARALGRALHRPALLPMPALALRVVFGEAASVLLDSQRVRPARLQALGFPYAFSTLSAALENIVGKG